MFHLFLSSKQPFLYVFYEITPKNGVLFDFLSLFLYNTTINIV